MNLRTALRAGIEQLTQAQVPSATTTAEVLLLHVLDRDRAFLHAHPEQELASNQEQVYSQLLRERAAGTPTQYLTGHQEFWGLDFHVTPGVFIPRPETEHLVEAVLERAEPADADAATPPGHLRIVDVGTGTGAIAIALARELEDAEIFAVDRSTQALELARHNARRLGVAERVYILESDLLEVFLPEAESSPFDFVVSNPPYVNPAEAADLPAEVREHEPATALFAPEGGLGVYRGLLEQAAIVLRLGGWLIVEMGYNMRERVLSLLEPKENRASPWGEQDVHNDLAGIPRVLIARKRY